MTLITTTRARANDAALRRAARRGRDHPGHQCARAPVPRPTRKRREIPRDAARLPPRVRFARTFINGDLTWRLHKRAARGGARGRPSRAQAPRAPSRRGGCPRRRAIRAIVDRIARHQALPQPRSRLRPGHDSRGVGARLRARGLHRSAPRRLRRQALHPTTHSWVVTVVRHRRAHTRGRGTHLRHPSLPRPRGKGTKQANLRNSRRRPGLAVHQRRRRHRALQTPPAEERPATRRRLVLPRLRGQHVLVGAVRHVTAGGGTRRRSRRARLTRLRPHRSPHRSFQIPAKDERGDITRDAGRRERGVPVHGAADGATVALPQATAGGDGAFHGGYSRRSRRGSRGRGRRGARRARPDTPAAWG
mmetsp:Transcript_2355/g.11494  ORF Transcript_2355/g.11494 Transcript_2355/m.11494 type:complete len:362 (-) Transcript_2355:1343-2428(-)